MSRFTAYLRITGFFLLGVYLLLAALLLTLRYAVLPHINEWRPSLETHLSKLIKQDVKIGHVSMAWQQGHIVIQLDSVALNERSKKNGGQVLYLPKVRGQLDWLALLQGHIQFSSLDVQDLEIIVRRDTDGYLWVAGHRFELSDAAPILSFEDPFAQWISTQPHLLLHNSTLVWDDDNRSSEPLVLHEVNLLLEGGQTDIRLGIEATAGVGEGESFSLRGHFWQADRRLPRLEPEAWDGLLYINIDHLVPEGWRPWVDVPSRLVSGDAAGQWWLAFEKGEPTRFAFQALAQNVRWLLPNNKLGYAQQGELKLAGSWAELDHLLHQLKLREKHHLGPDSATLPHDPKQKLAEGIAVQLSMTHAELDLTSVFTEAFDFDSVQINGRAHFTANRGWRLGLEKAQLLNTDFDLDFQGFWQQTAQSELGEVGVTGLFHRARLAAIGKYMPKMVNRHARDWLNSSLLAGEFRDTHIALSGLLEAFPFERQSSQGDFWVSGPFYDAEIDYAPEDPNTKAWPRLHAVNGKATLHRADLRIAADSAQMLPDGETEIRLFNLKAQIPNLEKGELLLIRGDSQGEASAYLGLLDHSPLGVMLNGVLDDMQSSGSWQVPLKLSIPLEHTENTHVEGRIELADNTVSLRPNWPSFDHVNGQVFFTEKAVWTRDLELALLGGKTLLSGGVGGALQGFVLSGDLASKQLIAYADSAQLLGLSGSFLYKAGIRLLEHDAFDFSLQSNLKGLAINLLPPFNKSPKDQRAFRLVWRSPHQQAAQLDFAFADILRARLMRARDPASNSYFSDAVFGVGMAPPVVKPGSYVDVRQSFIDLDAWYHLIDQLHGQLESKEQASTTILPRLQSVRIQADALKVLNHPLDHVALTAQRQEVDDWRIDIRSTQTAGSVILENLVKGQARVNARFGRLALGVSEKNQEQQTATIKELPDDIVVPAINLDVERLSLYGRDIGRLVLAGESIPNKHAWEITQLQVQGDGAQLDGSGLWRLAGPRRGLNIKAQVNISDAGAYLDQINLDKVLKAGSGQLSGEFEWGNFPWEFARVDLDGRIRLAINKGRFVAMNSPAARLLEVLSWQSLPRLARLEVNPSDPFRDGLPFDQLSGDIAIARGIMRSDDLSMTGPAAHIALQGDVDLINGQLNLSANVAPNLDMSGASLAAGLAINPLVGVGAFLTQWALKKPLSRAMANHYHVEGSWNDPEVRQVSRVEAATHNEETPDYDEMLDSRKPITPAEGLHLGDEISEAQANFTPTQQ